MTDAKPQRNRADPDAFLRLLTEHERKLAIYVFGLVPQLSDAEDILQETKLVLWRQFEKFEHGTNFLAWVRKIAFHQILNYRRRQKRRNLQWSEAFLESVAAEIEKDTDNVERRSEFLHECLAKLSEAHRRIILLRYYDELSVNAIAEKAGRSSAAVYRVLSRIRRTLHACVADKLQANPGTA